MFTTKQLDTIAQAVSSAVVSAVEALQEPRVEALQEPRVEALQEPRYIIYIGKKPRNVKAPYIAINADGQLSGFTEEADVLGHGTDRIGKWTMAEIEEKFPQYNHEYFLILVEN